MGIWHAEINSLREEEFGVYSRLRNATTEYKHAIVPYCVKEKKIQVV